MFLKMQISAFQKKISCEMTSQICFSCAPQHKQISCFCRHVNIYGQKRQNLKGQMTCIFIWDNVTQKSPLVLIKIVSCNCWILKFSHLSAFLTFSFLVGRRVGGAGDGVDFLYFFPFPFHMSSSCLLAFCWINAMTQWMNEWMNEHFICFFVIFVF